MGLEIDGVSGIIKNTTSDGDITIKGNDGGSEISALTFDISAAGAATFNNKIVATELDISGNVDVDGTTNLDIVDIDGAVDIAGALVTHDDFTLTGASTGAVWDSSNNSLDFADSTQLRFGAGADLKIFHDGSNSHIVDSGTGNLRISASAVQIMNAAGSENILLGTEDGAVTIYNNNIVHFNTSATESVFNEGSGNIDFRIETNNNANAFLIDGGNDTIALNDTAPDTTEGGICFNQLGADLVIISFKSSDIAHGMTSSAETDTYATFQKQSATLGGLQIRAFAEGNPNERLVINCQGDGDITTTKSASGKGAMVLGVNNKSGTSNGGVNSDANLLTIANYTSTRFIFDAEGTFHSDVGTATYDEYDDAQLVRAMDLSTSTKGLIASKFDEFVQYNHEDLANASIVGREEDGTPNSMVNWTAMSQLHNGAIWQQYEKTEKLANAMYELAKVAVGEDKANEILEQNEIKLLN